MTLLRDLSQFPTTLRGGAVSIGNFDGVHRGHAQIMARLRAVATELGGPAVVFTFDPHPIEVLRPHVAPRPLSTTARKYDLLRELGIDAVIAYPTDRAFLDLEARQFFEQVVCERLGARAVVEGHNFRFGRGRGGDVETMQQFCAAAGLRCEIVPAVELHDEVVSSSRVRAAVAAGRLDVVRRLLTRPYRVSGTVVHGAGRGRALGFPTANVADVATLLPAEGIYAGRAAVDGATWPAAISLGPNPTFGDAGQKFEAHLIGFDGDLYDRPLAVDFLARLRDVERFDSVEALLTQMRRDVSAAAAIAAEP